MNPNLNVDQQENSILNLLSFKYPDITLFVSFHFSFFVFVSFGDEVMKIQKYYVIFVYILQGKTGKMEI